MINHKVVRPIMALIIGVMLALYAYERITDMEPRAQRAREEALVSSAREILQSYVAPGGHLEIVDPLSPNRKVGKSYIYPTEGGWDVSGHYRRDADDWWHPYLMSLDGAGGLESLAVRDADDRLIGMSSRDPKFSAVPSSVN